MKLIIISLMTFITRLLSIDLIVKKTRNKIKRIRNIDRGSRMVEVEIVEKKDLNSKDYIKRSAFVLFLEKGYKEVTIKNIMEATNLSKGAIYHHFKSKEEIYFATLETYYFNLLKKDNLKYQSGNFVQDIESLYYFVAKLFAGIENLTEEGLNYPIRNFFIYQLKSENIESMRDQKIISVIKFRNKVRNIVATGIKSGQIKHDLDIEAVTSHIISFIEGLAIHHSTIKDDIEKQLVKNYKIVFNSYLKLICV